jgi:hypothetical protein
MLPFRIAALQFVCLLGLIRWIWLELALLFIILGAICWGLEISTSPRHPPTTPTPVTAQKSQLETRARTLHWWLLVSSSWWQVGGNFESSCFFIV